MSFWQVIGLIIAIIMILHSIYQMTANTNIQLGAISQKGEGMDEYERNLRENFYKRMMRMQFLKIIVAVILIYIIFS